AAELPAPHPVLDLLRGPERTGRVMPGHGRVPEQLAEAAGHGDARSGVLPARLDQQYLGGGIGRQPVRQDTAGRAGTDDDGVETGHRAAPGLLGQGSQRGRRRATLVPEEGAGKGHRGQTYRAIGDTPVTSPVRQSIALAETRMAP